MNTPKLTDLLVEANGEKEMASIDDVPFDKVAEYLQKHLKYPHVKVSVATLGGIDKATIFLHLSFQKPEQWANRIFQNSPYLIVSISPKAFLTVMEVVSEGIVRIGDSQHSTRLSKLVPLRKQSMGSQESIAQKLNMYFDKMMHVDGFADAVK